MSSWQVIEGDCLEVMRGMADGSVDMVLTDPPYNISQQNSITRNGGKYGDAADIDLDFGEWDSQWEGEEDYLAWCRLWLEQLARVIKPEHHVVFFFNWALFHPVRTMAEDMGLVARQPLYWVKTNPAPRARKVDFMKSHETAFWFTAGRSRQEFFNWSLGQQLDYVPAPVPHSDRVHPTQKAEQPLRVWMNYLSGAGGTVLDPFCGSGTTGVVAMQEGRNFVGIELSPTYAAMARERIARWHIKPSRARDNAPEEQLTMEELTCTGS